MRLTPAYNSLKKLVYGFLPIASAPLTQNDDSLRYLHLLGDILLAHTGLRLR